MSSSSKPSKRRPLVIVTEREVQQARATCIVVENTRHAVADLAAAFSQWLDAAFSSLPAVTGPTGKTTTTFLLKYIVKAGCGVGCLGTVRYEIGERVSPASTTPELLDVQQLLRKNGRGGCKAAAMEVSSDVLVQDRTRGLEWDVAVFTNLNSGPSRFSRTMDNAPRRRRSCSPYSPNRNR